MRGLPGFTRELQKHERRLQSGGPGRIESHRDHEDMALTDPAFGEVESAIEALRPAMQADGGDIEVVSVEAGVVSVRLRGTCLLCPSASLTMRYAVERTLRDRFPWIIQVVRVS
jgi:Fe-S cluster biogenesis protein NfuA